MKTASVNKKLKYKNIKLKQVANEYLTNISLDGNNDAHLKRLHFEKIISNDFDCFLNFNKISLEQEKQTEYFKYYKSKLTNENNRLKTARLDNFLQTEFNSNSSHEYIDEILSKKKSTPKSQDRTIITKQQQQQQILPSVTIVPNIEFNNSNDFSPINNTKSCVSDVESEYFKNVDKHLEDDLIKPIDGLEINGTNLNSLKKCLSSNATGSSNSSISQYSNSYKLSQSLSQALQSITHAKTRLNTRVSKSPNLEEESTTEISETILQNQLSQDSKSIIDSKSKSSGQQKKSITSYGSNTNYKQSRNQRTTSESSNESNYNNLNNTNSNTTKQLRSLMHYKPGLFNNLKKLNNEKLVLVSNSSPVGIFSRIPYRLSTYKYDLNDSILKVRNQSVVKAAQLTTTKSNYFVNDVFELLDLDFDEYIRQGEMSYVNLIDPASHSKQRYYRRTNTSNNNDDNEQGCINEKHEDLEINEKEDLLPGDSLKQSYKKEMNPFLITTYQPDYLDDPQLTELTAGKNRTCLKFPSYAVSIIDYVKPLDLKKEINETFKEKFPFIQISLTKLRSIKREMLEIGAECSLDSIIVAQSYIYFEQLILRGLINKTNRKLLAANCLLIASKLNDITKKDISKLIEATLNKFRLDNKKEIISLEFPILVALEFNLMIKYETDFISHYERLLNNSEYVKLYLND